MKITSLKNRYANKFTSLRLGSQCVALARRAMPRCRAARIDSISIFAPRRDGAMCHIVNLKRDCVTNTANWRKLNEACC